MRRQRFKGAPLFLGLGLGLAFAFLLRSGAITTPRRVRKVAPLTVRPHTPTPPANMSDPPKFYEEVLEGHRSNGYWVELMDITGNGVPDILAFGIIEGQLVWYENPYAHSAAGHFNRPWKRRVIAHLNQPIGMDHANVGGGRFNDFVVATQFGGNPYAIDNHGGQVYYFQNPLNRGAGLEGKWIKHYVGRATGAHRLRIGHFTQNHTLQVLVVPVAGHFGNAYSPITVKLFTRPSIPSLAARWHAEMVDDGYFRVAHGVATGRFHGDHGLDSVLVSSMEGISWLFYDTGAESWKRRSIAPGVPRGIPSQQQNAVHTFYGCQNVDYGRIGQDSLAFIATTGPFHGNVLMVYMKQSGSFNSLLNATWKEYYIHNFDQMTPNVDGSGPLHQVAAADLDDDGDDELLIASKKKGTYYAKIGGIGNGILQLTCLTEAPATRLALGDVDGDGMLDFATLGNTLKAPKHVDSKLCVYHNLKRKQRGEGVL